jgi:hypothetical protein
MYVVEIKREERPADQKERREALRGGAALWHPPPLLLFSSLTA